MSFKLIQYPEVDDSEIILQWQRDTFQRLTNSDISPLFIKDLGSWDMSSQATFTVQLQGLSAKSIDRVDILIVKDGELISSDASYGTGIESVEIFYATNTIDITRTTGGVYDSTDYDDLTINRGRIRLWT